MMRKVCVCMAVAGMCLALRAPAAEKQTAQKPAEVKTPAAKLSYSLGQEIGESLKRLETEIDAQAFSQGVQDSLKGAKPRMSAEEMEKTKRDFFSKKQEERLRKMKEVGEKNQKEADAFLAENKKKPGVVTTASGLQYMVLTEGTGATPKDTDRVTVHYKGTLLDGTEFDSSYRRGQPATFPVKGVIPGWTEALQLMKVGSKWKLFIPPQIAYGERGAGATIGPNSLLVFEVELLEIAK